MPSFLQKRKCYFIGIAQYKAPSPSGRGDFVRCRPAVGNLPFTRSLHIPFTCNFYIIDRNRQHFINVKIPLDAVLATESVSPRFTFPLVGAETLHFLPILRLVQRRCPSCLGFCYIFFTTPLTFNLIVSMLSSPSLSTTLTATVCTPALNVYVCFPDLSRSSSGLNPFFSS